jgi:hypothetical protein
MTDLVDVSEYSESGETRPAGFAEGVIPANSNLDKITRGVYVGVTGSLEVTMAGGTNIVTFVAVQAGSLLPIRVSQIRANSTATNIVAIY